MQELMYVLPDPSQFFLCWIGAAIGAAGSLIGGLLGKDSAEDAAKKNAALQREFAQNSIQWKTEDAKKAGIHPLYAMGAPTYSATPSYVGDNSFGAGIANAGQDIGRAIDATRTAPQKLTAFQETAQKLELERAHLVNQGLKADLAAKAAATMRVPPMASAVDPYRIPGQTQSGVKTVPLERIASAHNHPFAEAGPVSDVGYTRTYTGGLAPVYSADAKARLEDDYLGMLAWNLRNRVIPSLTLGAFGPTPPGHRGFYDPLNQEYVSWSSKR